MYYIVYGVFYLMSLLPWRALYILSDCIYPLLYYVIGYRKEVVMKNLAIAFPEKTEEERKQIAKEFYKNFVDNFIETVKFISISKEELSRRFTFDHESLNELYKTGKNIQFTLGHFFNWEFANLAYSAKLLYPFIVVYMPVENKIFNRLFKKIRQRFGTHLVSATNFKNEFAPYAKQQHALILVGDQSAMPDRGYWVDFFGKKTPFVKGPDRSARLNNAVVMFVNFYPVKRGYYNSEIVFYTANPRLCTEGEITKQMITFIEDTIRKHPSNYLWSHRRWKWEFDEAKYGKQVI